MRRARQPIPQSILRHHGKDHPNLVILDGSFATELERLGLAPDTRALWSIRAFARLFREIGDIPSAYYSAGACVVRTTTYHASFSRLRQYYKWSLDDFNMWIASAVAMLRHSQAHVRMKFEKLNYDPLMLIAGSIGPFGAHLGNGAEHTGDYGSLPEYIVPSTAPKVNVDTLMTFHRPLVHALAMADVDLLFFETIPSGIETRAILGLLEEIPATPAWLSFSLRRFEYQPHIPASEIRLADSTPIQSLIPLLRECRQVAAIGINCLDPRLVAPILKALVPMCGSLPVLVCPNSGAQWDPKLREWYAPSCAGLFGTESEDSPVSTLYIPTSTRSSREMMIRHLDKRFAEMARQWVLLGAQGIGGCCGITPETIRSVVAATTSQDSTQ